VDEPDDVVDVLVVDGEAGVAGLARQLEHLVDRGGVGQRGEVDPGVIAASASMSAAQRRRPSPGVLGRDRAELARLGQRQGQLLGVCTSLCSSTGSTRTSRTSRLAAR
jgi:hypothetical protein